MDALHNLVNLDFLLNILIFQRSEHPYPIAAAQRVCGGGARVLKKR